MHEVGEEFEQKNGEVTLQVRVMDVAPLNRVASSLRLLGAVEGEQCEVLRIVGVRATDPAEEVANAEEWADAGAAAGEAYQAALEEGAASAAAAGEAIQHQLAAGLVSTLPAVAQAAQALTDAANHQEQSESEQN